MSRPGRTHLPWAVWLAYALAVAAGGLLALTDLAGMVMGSWDTPAHTDRPYPAAPPTKPSRSSRPRKSKGCSLTSPSGRRTSSAFIT